MTVDQMTAVAALAALGLAVKLMRSLAVAPAAVAVTTPLVTMTTTATLAMTSR